MGTTESVAQRIFDEALHCRVDVLTSARPVELQASWTSSLRAAHRSIDEALAAVDNADADAGQVQRDLVEVERLRRRVDAVRLRLIARAEARRVPERSGYVDTGAWVASTTKGDRRPAASDGHLAQAIERDPGTDDEQDPQRQRLTLTGRALDEGRISAEHAKVIARGVQDLPDTVTAVDRATCEEELVALAANRSPAQLRAASRRVLAKVESEAAVVDAHEELLVATEEERAEEHAAFWIKDNQDGTMTGHFTVPWVCGATLKKVIDAMTAPRRQQTTTNARPDHQHAGVDWQHRRGLAFADLLTRIPTDHLNHKVAATILVTTRLEDLRCDLDGSRRVGSTDTGDVVSAGTARRLACGAGIIPTVLGGDSMPLDLGRQARLFSDHQRTALSTRYTECAAQGCDRPFAWTEVHHLKAWQHGGTTDLANAVPLCGSHHRMIERPGWAHTTTHRPDGTVSIRYHRRT